MGYMSIGEFKGKTFVIKYGGSIMNDSEELRHFVKGIVYLKRYGINIIIVHGGGPEISKWLDKLNIKSEFINGLRVTDKSVMDIVEMVLSAHINKEIVANLCSYGLDALGISGRDSNLLQAKKKYLNEEGRKIDIGFVGEVVSVNTSLIYSFFQKGIIPVISPVGGDCYGNKYNINADYAASFISSSIKAEKLIIATDVEGVYKDINDKSTLIKEITVEEIKEYIKNGIISGGMIPKMQCCIEAIENGTKNIHLIDGRKNSGLINNILSESGTKIVNGGE